MKKQFLCFSLDNEWYLTDISSVREIIPYLEPNPLPGSNPENLGLLDMRGSVLTVFSGRLLLSLSPEADTEQQKTIILEKGDDCFGIVVDDVAEIVTVDTDEIEHSTERGEHQMILGTVTHNRQLMIVIDFFLNDDLDLSQL